jgi:hypothetical protein
VLTRLSSAGLISASRTQVSLEQPAQLAALAGHLDY